MYVRKDVAARFWDYGAELVERNRRRPTPARTISGC
jgi:hypothetical protein